MYRRVDAALWSAASFMLATAPHVGAARDLSSDHPLQSDVRIVPDAFDQLRPLVRVGHRAWHFGYECLFEVYTDGRSSTVGNRTIEVERDDYDLSEVADKHVGHAASAEVPQFHLLRAANQPLQSLPRSCTRDIDKPSIGFSTVDAILRDLQSNPKIEFATQAGWKTASDLDRQTFWSFPPPTSPDYPSAVKRVVMKGDSSVAVRMNVLCQAPQQACDRLVRAFQALNEHIRESVSQAQ
jgi:hypothetical protein